MTWKEIKLITLQKMFAAEGNTIPNDESTQEYIAGMPAVANEAMQMLCTAGKYIVNKIEIAFYPCENLLGEESKCLRRFDKEEVIFQADNANAYYFEFSGDGRLDVYVGSRKVKSEKISSRTAFSVFKDIIENPDGETVTLKMLSECRGAMKNVCLYAEHFFSKDDVQPDTGRIAYDMYDLVEDFYSFDPQNIYFEGDRLTQEYIRTHNLFDESGHVFLLPADMPGNYTVYYRAYPDMVSNVTADNYQFKLDPEVVVLLPLYMASQLYKDDDNGIATAYRNEFEVALERLQHPAKLSSSEQFVNKRGWI